MPTNINGSVSTSVTSNQPVAWILDIPWQIIAVILGFVVLCLFIFLFRKDISGWMKRWTHVGGDKSGIDSVPEEPVVFEPDSKEEQVPPEKDEPEEPTEPEQIESPKTLEDWRKEMFIAFLDRDIERADNAHKKILEMNDDPVSTKEDEINYFRWSHRVGNTDAINNIRSFLNDTDVAYDANMALGHSFTFSDDFESANKYFTSALEIARNEEEKTYAIVNISRTLYRLAKKQESLNKLFETLSTISEDKNKVILYECLADLYEKEKDYENRAFVLDKAIEIKPNDSDLLFKAGYSYAESVFDEISLVHYKNAKWINPKDETVQNNLGVLYDKMNMPIKSIASYREAEKLGNTLASANLGYRLINAGFVDEAKTILESATLQEEVHPNVNSALADIQAKKDSEKETETSKETIAQNYRRFFLSFIDAKTTQPGSLAKVSGEYKTEGGSEYYFDISGNKLIGTWKEKLFSSEREWKLEGEIQNNSSVIEVSENEYNFRLQKEFNKKGSGYLFCTPEGNEIKIVWVEKLGKNKRMIVLNKKS